MHVEDAAKEGDYQAQFKRKKSSFSFSRFCYNSLMLYPTHLGPERLMRLTECEKDRDEVQSCDKLPKVDKRVSEIPDCDVAKLKELYTL